MALQPAMDELCAALGKPVLWTSRAAFSTVARRRNETTLIQRLSQLCLIKRAAFSSTQQI
jgi:hypothetical protein